MEESFEFSKSISYERMDSDFFMHQSEDLDYEDPCEKPAKRNWIPSFSTNQSLLVSNKGFTKRCDWVNLRNAKSLDEINKNSDAFKIEILEKNFVDFSFEEINAKGAKNYEISDLCRCNSSTTKAHLTRCASWASKQKLGSYQFKYQSGSCASKDPSIIASKLLKEN